MEKQFLYDMGPDHYKVEVLHYINPYLIWVLVRKEGNEETFVFEQIGIYGILPQNITFEADCVVKMERCEQWMPAAVLVMKQTFLEATEVWFSPTYIDKKVSIFDDNTHKYGDLTIILKNGEHVNLNEEIIKCRFAFEDECIFHQELREGNLKTKLNHTAIVEVMHKIEESYAIRDVPKKLWLDALKNQTMVFEEVKLLEKSITSRKMEVQDGNNMETLLKNKLNDLKLCKDIDEDSAGRASSARNSRPSSLLSVALKKKLDLLKSQHNLDFKLCSRKSNDKSFEVEQNNNDSSITFKEFKQDDNNNVDSKKSNKPRKPSNQNNKETKLIAFGPAGLQTKKFNIKSELIEKEEPVVVSNIQKTEAEVIEEEKEGDVYSKTDSEVNIKIPNLEILKIIKSKNSMLENTVANNCKNVDAKVEKLGVIMHKLRYLEEKLTKINDSSSISDRDSSKLDIDSDGESVTDLEEKLGLLNITTKKDVNPEPETETLFEDVKSNVNPFKNIDGSVSIFVDKLVTPILMVHTKKDNRIQPISDMRDIPLGTDIHTTLKNMSIQKPMRLQTVSWPTILRGHSFFLIGPHGSGNTMGYLPAVCRLVNDFKNTPGNFGLSCIIVCATSESVSAVEYTCKMFLHSAKILAYYTGMSDVSLTTSLLNGCDLLICTPTMLVRLIQEDFSLDIRSLSTFVIDDCERISKIYPNELKYFLLKIRDLVKNRANKEWKVQYIVVSRIWCDFMLPLARKAPDSVVCISAFEECVLYSKATTSVEFVLQENKLDTVINFLKGIDKSKKTVIACRADEEVKLLEKALTKLKYVVFACDSTMTVHDLYNLDKNLKDYEEPVLGPILVCCDGNLTHLNVTDAQYLVHYSLPVLFSMFCKRFAVLIDNYPSIFKTEERNIKIKIMLDDNNIEQLPKILHFIKRCSNDVPTCLDEISTSVLCEKELKKAQNLVPICKELLTLGKCPDFWNCVARHAIFKDYDEPKAWLPKEGSITFQILHYHSAVYYSARITSCITKSNTIKYPQTYSLLSIKMGMYFSKEENKRLHGVPKVGDVCAVTLKLNLFARCQVMKILQSVNNQPNLVLIKLIDEERYETARDICLYHLPEDLKSIESHVVLVILANIMPQDRDVSFSSLAKNQLKRITEESDDLFMRGQIAFVVGNCMFVDTLEACQELSSLEEIVVKHDFRKELLDGHGLPNPDHIDNLSKLCDYKHSDTKEEVQSIDVPKHIKILPKGRWAHLEGDSFSPVFFTSAESPCKFFVRSTIFEKSMNMLIKDIKKYVTESPEPVENVNVGDMVLAEFPDDATFERARIDGLIDTNKVTCFFVDQGDWREVSVKKILSITEKLITQLPYQAIECRLVGIQPVGDEWTDFSTNFLVDNCYDSADKLKHLYTKYFTKEKAEFTEGHKYGVVLIDTYGDEDVIINQMMIDKNLAEENEEIEYLNNVQFKRETSELSDSNSDVEDELKKTRAVVTDTKYENTQQLPNVPSNNLLRSVPLFDSDNSSDDFDFVPNSAGNLGSVHVSQIVSIKEVSELESNDTRTELPELTSTVKSSSSRDEKHALKIDLKNDCTQISKPKLVWRQNNNIVTIKIKVIVDNYDITIKERSIKFFANANDTEYGFEFELYGVVDMNKCSHSNKGQYVQVKLWKLMARRWLTLTRSSVVTKWIVYDVESIDVSSDEESDNIMTDTKNLISNLDESDSDDNIQDDISFTYKRE